MGNIESNVVSQGDLGCTFLKLFEWIMTPGFWEELCKGMWLFMRFKPDPHWTKEHGVNAQMSKSVPRTTCCCFPTTVCTFWWRIAYSPAAIFMSSLAAGGGFQAVENVEYMVLPMA